MIPAMRDFLGRLDGWRDEQIEFLARLVNHDSGTDDPMDVNRQGQREKLYGMPSASRSSMRCDVPIGSPA
jgi:hypothetical protein